MAAKAKKFTELTCVLCSYPLTSYKAALTEEVLSIIAEPQHLRKPQHELAEKNQYAAIDKDQVVATKCGHMYHMGCLRTFIKTGIEKKGAAFCPICTKPVTLARVWPVLIPPTINQVTRFEKLASLKDQNARLRDDLRMMRQRIQDSNCKLKKSQQEVASCIEDIQEKQSSLEQLVVPSEEDLDELRKIHKKRQQIVKVVTKHNADLLELLMRETNVHVSEAEIASERPPFESKIKKRKSKKTKRHRHPPLQITTEYKSPTNVQASSSLEDLQDQDLSIVTFSSKSSEVADPRGGHRRKTLQQLRKPPPMDFIISPASVDANNNLQPQQRSNKGKHNPSEEDDSRNFHGRIYRRGEVQELLNYKDNSMRKRLVDKPGWRN